MDNSVGIYYSTQAKAHELTMLRLKHEKLSYFSSAGLAKEYSKIYNEIYTELDQERRNK